ncbi:MAG: gliding motility-associated C-terminal domain-containing protein [Saprospiraceae bacterium]|nr:gliding motility-associated C-terminal domain-containing protein [Saprospiraceae bacterium]
MKYRLFAALWMLGMLLILPQLQAQGPLNLSFNGVTPTCFSSTNGSANVQVSGGQQPYTYLWNNGHTSPNNTGLPSGTYAVTVSDASGATSSGNIMLVAPSELTVSIASTTPACGANNGSATATASGGVMPYTYLWSNGNTGPTAINLAPGQHSVTVTDANACQQTHFVTIPSLPGFTVSLIINKAECVGVADGSAIAVPNPLGPSYTYVWNPPTSTTGIIDSLEGGQTISVTVTDPNTGCQATATGVVAFHTQIQVNVTDVDVACAGELTGSATATATHGNPPYSYTWTYPDNSTVNGQTITNLGVGSYLVQVVDDHGCEGYGAADINEISQLEAGFNYNIVECKAEGILVQFTDASSNPTAAIDSWQWFIAWNNDTLTSTLQNPPAFIAPDNTTGVAILTVSSNGCVKTVSDTFYVTGIVDVNVAIEGGSGCDGLPVLISVDGNPNYQYTWTPTDFLTTTDSLDVVVNPPTSQTYTLVVANGTCKDTFPITITRSNLLLQVDDLGACQTSAILSAQASNHQTIVWTNAAGDTLGTSPNLNVTAGDSTLYIATIADALGCTVSDSAWVFDASIEVSLPSIDFPCESKPLQYGLTFDADYIVSYQWSANSPLVQFAPSNTSANPFITAPAGQYTIGVVVTNQFNCSDSSSIVVVFQELQVVEPGALQVDNCDGLSVTFTNTSGIGGIWYFGDGDTSSFNIVTHDYATSGNYTVIFLPFDYLCAVGDTLNVVVDSMQALTAAIGADYIDCAAEAEIQFLDQSSHNNPLATWQWTIGTQTFTTQNPTVVFTNEGTIQAILVVTDVNGCSSSDTLTVQVNIINDAISNLQSICTGNSVALNPDTVAGYTYAWTATPPDPTLDANAANPTVTPQQTTLYVATITNGACTVVDSVVVDVDDMQMIEPGQLLADTCNGLAVTFTNNSGFNGTWYFGDGDTSTLNVVTHDYTTGGTYAIVFVPFDVLCVQGDTFNITFDDIQSVVAGIGADYVDCSVEAQIQFTDQSTHTAPIATWMWTIGTQTFNTQNPTAVFTTQGTVQAILVVTDVNGCRSSDTMAVQINIVNDAIADALSICAGQSVSLNPDTVAGYTYAWTANPVDPTLDANAGNPTVSPQQPTTYFATITNGACTVVDSVAVDVDPLQIIQAGQLLADTCNGLAVLFTNNSGFNGTWYFGDGDTSTLNVVTHDYATGGTYTVSFIPLESLCVQGDTFSITFDATQAITAGIGAEYVNCAVNAQIQFFDQSAHTDPIATWMWTIGTQTFNTQNPSAVFTTEGTVQAILVITDVNGCRSMDTMDVQINIVNDAISNEQFICVGENVALNPDTVAGYTYVWTATPADPTLDPNAANPVVSPQQNTSYTVSISNGACTVLDTVEVQPDLAPQLDLSVDQMVVCSDDSVNIAAQVTGSSNQVLWSMTTDFSNPFATGPNITVIPVANGVYYAMIANSANCFDIDTVQIDNASFEIENEMAENKVCLGNTITLMVSSDEPNLTFDWSDPLPNDPTQTITPTTSSVYGVTVSNPDGCTNTATFVVDVVDVTASAWVTRDTLFMPGDTTTLIGGPEDKNITYSWEPAGTVDDPNQRISTARPTETTVYTLTTELDGCFDTASVIVRVISQTCIDPFIFVPKAFTPNGDGENDVFRARGVDIAELHMIVWNRWGEKVFETENPLDSWDGIFRENPVPPDSYAWFLKVTCGNGEYYEAKGDVTLLR